MSRSVLLSLAAAAGLLAQNDPAAAPAVRVEGAAKEVFDVHALLKLNRVADPQISPDGNTVSFTVQTIDVESNARPKQIYIVPLWGGVARQITFEGKSNERARWSPDSKQIAFISDRGGSSQIWIMNADGSEPRQVTNLSTEASGVMFARDGKNLVFVSEVYPGCADDDCNKKRLEAEKASQVKARIYESLLYRHWNQWQGERRSHLMVVPVEGGPARDLTPHAREVPPFSLGGPDDYAISPDSKEICFAMNVDPNPATSTNLDLYVVPISGGPALKVTLNPGADASPVYSPDGRYIAFRTQSQPGYESDRWRLAVYDRITDIASVLTEELDRWVTGLAWAPDSTRIFFTVEDRGRQSIQFIPAMGGAARVAISGDNHLDDIQFTPDGKNMIYTEQSGSRPVEIVMASATGGTPRSLTRMNDAVLARYGLRPFEEFWVEGAEKTRVHGFVLKPQNFDASKRYPVLMLIHGGPQGAWSQAWSYRWNPQVFAAAGYVVVMPNPRGSTGYGQQFIEEISGDWGGKVYDDLMAATNYAASIPYADEERMAAAGGSYGGYMANWILGHSDRFKALVSHAGVFDLRSMVGETEELWFPQWEFKGMPWENPEMYAQWSPSYFVQEFRTPTLVIHGELDYRVPVGQGLQLFTALQMRKVPSKMLLFPDEGHWILKPQNSVLWYQTFTEWLNRWTK